MEHDLTFEWHVLALHYVTNFLIVFVGQTVFIYSKEIVFILLCICYCRKKSLHTKLLLLLEFNSPNVIVNNIFFAFFLFENLDCNQYFLENMVGINNEKKLKDNLICFTFRFLEINTSMKEIQILYFMFSPKILPLAN